MSILQRQARWYVYELFDPRDGVTFYVGKGSGKRIHAHEKDAAAGKVCSRKINKIKELWFADLEVGKRINAVFWSEASAYDHETDLIDEIGLDNLTNVMAGGSGAWAERKAKRAQARIPAPIPLHVAIAKASPRLIAGIVEWLRIGGERGTTIKAMANDQQFKLHAQITEFVYNQFFPKFWGEIKANEKAFDVFARRAEPMGLKVVHGCA